MTAKLKERISKILGYTPYDEQLSQLETVFSDRTLKIVKEKRKKIFREYRSLGIESNTASEVVLLDNIITEAEAKK